VAHPLVEQAARGKLPPWSAVGEKRMRHIERVAGLLEDWASVGGLSAEERTRWVAAGYLHDALKEKPEDELRALLAGEDRDLPEPILHGPAVAMMLRREGVDDEELLRALAYHTLGHPELGRTGSALYAADFLEPGRDLKNEWRAALRARMPGEIAAVVKEILAARINFLIEQGRPVRRETVEFWNRVAEGQAWASSSEL
jgi:2-amino-4-hydroxy-6-hydroxymethyldihydropteridine diphosphokinase